MSFFKRSVDKLSKIYGDTIPSIFSIALLFLIIFALSTINEIASYISLGLLLFLFFPLLLSTQIFVSRIFSYKTDLNYKDIYKQMGLYYTPMFKGIFSVFSAFIFTLLSIFLFSLIFENVAILLNPELGEYIITSPDDLINKIMELPYFNLSVVIMFGLMTFVFLYRIFSKAINVYLACYCGIHKDHLKTYNRYIKLELKYDIKKNLRSVGFPLMMIFIVLYLLSSIISYYLLNNIDYAIFIGISITTIGCALYLPIYFSGCYCIAMDLKTSSPRFLKREITREYEVFMNNPKLSDDEKNIIKERYEKVSQIFPSDEEKEENEDEKKE